MAAARRIGQRVWDRRLAHIKAALEASLADSGLTDSPRLRCKAAQRGLLDRDFEHDRPSGESERPGCDSSAGTPAVPADGVADPIWRPAGGPVVGAAYDRALGMGQRFIVGGCAWNQRIAIDRGLCC